MRSFLHLSALTAGLVVATGATAQPSAPTTTPPATTAPASPSKPSIANWSFLFSQEIKLAEGEKMVLKRATRFEKRVTFDTIVDAEGTPLPQQAFEAGSILDKDLIVMGKKDFAPISIDHIFVSEGSEFPSRISLPPKKKMDVIGGVAIPSDKLPDGAAVKAELLSLKERVCPDTKAEIQALRTEVAQLKEVTDKRWEVTITYKDAENFVKKPELEAVVKKLREERAKIVEVALPSMSIYVDHRPMVHAGETYYWCARRSWYYAYRTP